jgi:hypothetical protein
MLSSMVLQYQYTFDPTREEIYLWTDIKPLLNSLVKVELDKMEDEDKEEFLSAIARRPNLAQYADEKDLFSWDYVQVESLLQKQASWSFVDDQVPFLFKDWETGMTK